MSLLDIDMQESGFVSESSFGEFVDISLTLNPW